MMICISLILLHFLTILNSFYQRQKKVLIKIMKEPCTTGMTQVVQGFFITLGKFFEHGSSQFADEKICRHTRTMVRCRSCRNFV